MEKKNTAEVIKKLGDINKLTVQKSKPLFALWQSELSLAEFKILDTYLGRINSHDDEHRTVLFEKGELEKLLGIKQLKPQVLDERLKNLMTTVRIPDDSKRGFTRISLFEKAHAQQDEYGVWEVELTCTETAKKYIFNIEEIQYLRYKLKNIVNVKSRYSYILFLYIWENKFRGTWQIQLEDLKVMLKCESERYKQFKFFNQEVLKKCHKEINTVTDIEFDYEVIKKGRFVVAIGFTYKAKERLEMEDEFLVLVKPEESMEEKPELWAEPLLQLDLDLTKEQFDEVFSILTMIPDYKLPDVGYGIEISRYHYLDNKVKEILRRNTKDPIRLPYSYLIKLMKKDAELA